MGSDCISSWSLLIFLICWRHVSDMYCYFWSFSYFEECSSNMKGCNLNWAEARENGPYLCGCWSFSHSVGQAIWLFVWSFLSFEILCERTAKALLRLRGFAGSPMWSLFACVISTVFTWTGSIMAWVFRLCRFISYFFLKKDGYFDSHEHY